jgi:hypothetical protein
VERPYELIESLNMLRFYGAAFVTVSMELEKARSKLGMEWMTCDFGVLKAREEVSKALSLVETEMKRLPLSQSFQEQLRRLKARVDSDGLGGSDELEHHQLLTVLAELEANLQIELQAWLFFSVRPDKRAFYESPAHYFGGNVVTLYSDSEVDLKAAGRCFALDEWTACVFHLMRAVEMALHKWANQLGAVQKVPVTEANWQEIIDGAHKALKEIEALPRSKERASDLEYFGETTAQFSSFKNAWRNHVAHGRQCYDEKRANEVMEAVRAFMGRLASRS